MIRKWVSNRGLGKKLNYCNGLGELWSDFYRSYVNSLSVVKKFSIVVKAAEFKTTLGKWLI